MRMPVRLTVVVLAVTVAAVGLAGCSGDVSPIERAEAQVSAKEKALAEAESAFTSASDG